MDDVSESCTRHTSNDADVEVGAEADFAFAFVDDDGSTEPACW